VVEIQVLEAGSGSKSSIGTGFYISSEGHVVTNYHVISRVIYYPEKYRARLVDHKGAELDIQVLGIDVVNDLAIVRAAETPADYFQLGPVRMRHGARLYSLGYPYDIGITIVEGTFNGYMEKSFYRRIHFTGSLNPGMSGGPVVDGSGRVVGVNVATAGNQVSFVVPVAAVSDLVMNVKVSAKDVSENFMGAIRSQLNAHQEEYFSNEIFDFGKHVELGPYSLPTEPSKFINCWGDASSSDEMPYESVSHICSGIDSVFVSSRGKALSISFRHRLLKSKNLNRFRFFSLYESSFSDSYDGYDNNEDEVTKFICDTDYIESNGITFKAIFCIRKHRKLEGLYDVVFKAAALESMSKGLLTTLTLNGVTYETARLLVEEYLRDITWTK
jgi:hypothetical protein